MEVSGPLPTVASRQRKGTKTFSTHFNSLSANILLCRTRLLCYGLSNWTLDTLSFNYHSNQDTYFFSYTISFRIFETIGRISTTFFGFSDYDTSRKTIVAHISLVNV